MNLLNVNYVMIAGRIEDASMTETSRGPVIKLLVSEKFPPVHTACDKCIEIYIRGSLALPLVTQSVNRRFISAQGHIETVVTRRNGREFRRNTIVVDYFEMSDKVFETKEELADREKANKIAANVMNAIEKAMIISGTPFSN